MALEEILRLYSEDEKIDNLKPNELGICRLAFSDSVIVSWENSSIRNGFYQYSAIGTVPVSTEKEVFLNALSGNLFCNETGPATLAYIETKRILVLFRFFDNETPYRTFKEQIPDFVGHVQYWKQKLDTTEEAPIDETSLNKHFNRLNAANAVGVIFP